VQRTEAYEDAPGPKVADLRECGSIEELTLTEELKGDRSDYEDAHQCLVLVAALSSLATTTEGTSLQAAAPAQSVSQSCNETRLRPYEVVNESVAKRQ
jgi:hypothetical protein